MISRTRLSTALVGPSLSIFLVAGAALAGCSDSDGDGPDPSDTPAAGDRTPELADPSVVRDAKVTLGDALAQVEAAQGVVIEAKFELDDGGTLSLSTYPIGKTLAEDAERNVFQEAAGDATATPWTPALEPFHDQEHLTRSSRDLTLVQLSARSVRDAVAEVGGIVYWAIPTISTDGHAGFGVYTLDPVTTYRFVDGNGDRTHQVLDLGTGPGAGATDARTPELGTDLTVLRTANTSMRAAIDQAGKPIIEAKYELGEDGKLSLSLYPIDQGLDVAAEHQALAELAGDPTAVTWSPAQEVFAVPDEEHLTRAARDLTLVQASTVSLRDAIVQAEGKFAGGIVYWAIPTRRGTTAGYGIYVLDATNQPHYLFIS